MPLNKFYKKNFTQEECDKCFQWFEARMDKLPQQLEVQSMKFYDLRYVVQRNVRILRRTMPDNPTYSGQFALLLMLREELMKQGLT